MQFYTFRIILYRIIVKSHHFASRTAQTTLLVDISKDCNIIIV